MSRESNMNTIRAIFEADARKDVNGFVDRFDTNCTLVLIPTGQAFRGTDQLKQLVQAAFMSQIRTKEITNLFATEDSVCVEYTNRITWTGKEAPVWKGPELSEGSQLEVKMCWVCHVNENGKIDHVNEYFDALSATRSTSE